MAVAPPRPLSCPRRTQSPRRRCPRPTVLLRSRTAVTASTDAAAKPALRRLPPSDGPAASGDRHGRHRRRLAGLGICPGERATTQPRCRPEASSFERVSIRVIQAPQSSFKRRNPCRKHGVSAAQAKACRRAAPRRSKRSLHSGPGGSRPMRGLASGGRREPAWRRPRWAEYNRRIGSPASPALPAAAARSATAAPGPRKRLIFLAWPRSSAG